MIAPTECPDCGVMAQECEKGYLKRANEPVSPVVVSYWDCYTKSQKNSLAIRTWGNGVKMQSIAGEDREAPEEGIGTESEFFLAGAIVDSWVESSSSADASALLVLQVAPRGHPKDLVIVEAEVSLVSDRLWLEDLTENLCHGSPVLVIGSRSFNGFFAASRLQLMR